jgi:hypothetical protein
MPPGMQTCLALHYGKSNKPIAFIVPDDKHANMWRILSTDRTLSDMVNLARAKDAAKMIAARNLSTATTVVSASRLHWKQTDDPRQKVKETA